MLLNNQIKRLKHERYARDLVVAETIRAKAGKGRL